jgi:hypothetical protein
MADIGDSLARTVFRPAPAVPRDPAMEQLFPAFVASGNPAAYYMTDPRESGGQWGATERTPMSAYDRLSALAQFAGHALPFRGGVERVPIPGSPQWKLRVGPAITPGAVPGESPAAAEILATGTPGWDAVIQHLRGRTANSLVQSKAMGQEVVDWLRNAGYKGLRFSPIGSSPTVGPESRVRLFEYLTGRKAIPPETLSGEYRIPLESP